MRYSRAAISATAILAYLFAAADVDVVAAPAKEIHFRDLGGVKSWRKGEKDTVVYVQVADNSWYRVDLYETCMKFVNEKGLRFITEEIETGERLSKVIADKYICTVIEMTKVDVPPPRQASK